MNGDTGHVRNCLEEKLADVLFVLPDRPAKDQLIAAGRGKREEPVGGHKSLPQSQPIIKASPRAKRGQVLNTGPGRFRMLLACTKFLKAHLIPAIDSKFAVPVSHLRDKNFMQLTNYLTGRLKVQTTINNFEEI